MAKARDHLSPAERMALCAPCHEDRERLARSDVSLEVVATYRSSFPGSDTYGIADSPR